MIECTQRKLNLCIRLIISGASPGVRSPYTFAPLGLLSGSTFREPPASQNGHVSSAEPGKSIHLR